MSDIVFVEANSSKLIAELINEFEKATGETLYPGDERRLFLLQLAPVLMALKNDINYSAKQNLLRYAAGQTLDAMGELYGMPRLPSQKAVVTMRFTLSAAQLSDIVIPAGIRVTPEGMLFFATEKSLTIPAGQLQGEVIAQSADAGSIYNGYVAGQIKTLVDPLPYIKEVVNIDDSMGGADPETDVSYRERIRQAPESFSVAGSTEAYIFWAKMADASIADISVTSPAPGEILIVPLLLGGQIPSPAILNKVESMVNSKDKRPLTDYVRVEAPDEVDYGVNITYYISRQRETEATAIRNAIEGSGGAVDQYIAWQREKLGRAINSDELRFRMMNAGAYRVEVASPAFSSIEINQVAVVSTISMIYGGIE